MTEQEQAEAVVHVFNDELQCDFCLEWSQKTICGPIKIVRPDRYAGQFICLDCEFGLCSHINGHPECDRRCSTCLVPTKNGLLLDF